MRKKAARSGLQLLKPVSRRVRDCCANLVSVSAVSSSLPSKRTKTVLEQSRIQPPNSKDSAPRLSQW